MSGSVSNLPFGNPDDLHLFYEDLVRTLRDRGVICGITSGLACVHYGVAETTRDCDLLCHPSSFNQLLDLLTATQVNGVPCQYRGNISPPLDARWHDGGWTSHFEWAPASLPVTLDVFGHALRESAPWPEQLVGLYASPQTVAEMKRTNRDKDWAFITALGVRMIESDDDQGWLHLFNADTLERLLEERPCPPELAIKRPALKLALEHSPLLDGALKAERAFWEELDRRRIRILERHLRPYVSAVRNARHRRVLSLREDHATRIDCATRYLPSNPLKEYGIEKYISEAKTALIDQQFFREGALTALPEVSVYFEWLKR